MSGNHTSPTTEIAIEKHLAGYGIGSLVSIRDIVAMVRTAAPGAEMSDRELAERIALHAIAKHCNISFDLGFENEQRTEEQRRTAA